MKLTKEELSWGLYDWANSAFSIIITTAIFPLYFKASMTNLGYTGTESTVTLANINGLTSIFVALLAPILGTIADYLGFKKRFFVFFLGIGILSCFGLGLVPETHFQTLALFYMLSTLGFSGSNIFYDAFLIDITPKDRVDRVSTIGYALGYIGSTIPFIISMALIIGGNNFFSSGYTAPKISFIITSIWWLIFSLPMIRNVKQTHGIKREKQCISKSFKRLINTFKNIQNYQPAFIFLMAYFFYIDGVGTIIKMASAYGNDLGIDSQSLLIILLATQFIAFPAAIVFGHLATKYGSKLMLYIAIFSYTLLTTYAFFLDSITEFWILGLSVGLFQGGIQAISRSYFSKLIPKEKANEFFGLYNVFGKFAAIMGPFLMAFAVSVTNNSRYGVISLVLLFIIGGYLLTKVQPQNT